MNRLLSSIILSTAALASNSFAMDATDAAKHYNSHFDFARSLHGTQIDALVSQGYATTLDDEGKHYRVDFGDSGYTDVRGNTYSGSYDYYRSQTEEAVGRVERMDFDNFQLNALRVTGAKVSIITAMEDGELKRVNWCSGRCSPRADQVAMDIEPLRYHLPNGETVEFSGIMHKEYVWTDHGQREVLITGEATIANAGNQFEFNIAQPLVMTPHCRWMKTGSTVMSGSDAVTREITYGEKHCDAGFALAGRYFPSQHELWD